MAGLVLSLAPWTFAAVAHISKSAHPGGAYVHGKCLRNSSEATSSGQADLPPDMVMVQAPEVRSGSLCTRFPKGSRLVRLEHPYGPPHSLTPDFFAAADPRVSFDGARVLFTGKKTTNSLWQIWEINMDGSGARQITHCPGDCLKPAYLPRGEIVFTAFSKGPVASTPNGSKTHGIKATAARSATPLRATSQLWVCKLDGSDAHAITFGPGDFEVETVLHIGTILATARSPLLPWNGLPADRELYTLRPDGTGLATLRCDHQHPAIRSQAQELDDGAVVFVKAALSSNNLGGDLAWIRRGALHNTPLTATPVVASSPHPIAADEILVARQSLAGPAKGRLALYAFDAASGKFGAPVYQDGRDSTVEAVPVAAHEPPRWYWSTLNPELQRGYFVCIDAYRAEGAPQGRIATKLTRIRVLMLDATTQHARLLGEAPIEEDGSFYIAVPSDHPVRFQVLDGAGHVVREQRSWLWSRSGEEHGCVGCHEDRALAPENRWPMALRRFDTPTRLDLANLPVSAH
ncbi:MAG: hypothetical protein WAO35_09155 [Terriglobia bacterium]